jgi:hypothetical protein
MSLWNKVKDFFTGFQQGSVHLPFIQSQEDKDVLIIDRKTWLRGEGLSFSSLLRNKDQKRCCLGYYYKFLGLPDKNMLGLGQPKSIPINLREKLNGADSWLFELNTNEPSRDNLELIRYNDCVIGNSIYNDTIIMTEEYRESKIKTMFAKHNIMVNFIN